MLLYYYENISFCFDGDIRLGPIYAGFKLNFAAILGFLSDLYTKENVVFIAF